MLRSVHLPLPVRGRLVLLLLAWFFARPAEAQWANHGAVPGELLVQFREEASATERRHVRAACGLSLIRRFPHLGVEHVRVAASKDLPAASQALRANAAVLLVQPNYLRHIAGGAPPNDPYWLDGTLWGMERIQVEPAWQRLLAPGNDDVVVGAVDTGVDYNHPDLAANIWVNPGEIPDNGLDDDGNGYIDDVHGIDVVHHTGAPLDDHHHGTHTAGTLAAVGNNGLGVVGVHWKAKLVVCKFLDASGNGTDAEAVECLDYLLALKQRGVNLRLTNNSWGGVRDPGDEYPVILEAAFNSLGAAGILNVCAAGNQGGRNLDSAPFDPASFPSPAIIAVAASDRADARSNYSNYGPTTVDLAAPGDEILSGNNIGGYVTLSGTSMATPHVAGAGALLSQFYPALSAGNIKALLLNTVDLLPQWAGLVVAGGRLNVARAVEGGAAAAAGPRILAIVRSGGNAIELQWSAVPGLSYRVLATDDLRTPFAPLSGALTAGAGETTQSFVDSSAADGSQKFYKVELLP